ncbi:MAG: hypothetical protein ACP5QK_12745, partial [Myxococcota bacterium]
WSFARVGEDGVRLYPLGSDKTYTYLPLTSALHFFKSHLVQIKQSILYLIVSHPKNFKSHLVQIKLDSYDLCPALSDMFKSTWFR